MEITSNLQASCGTCKLLVGAIDRTEYLFSKYLSSLYVETDYEVDYTKYL
jgi:hypothetical protein